MGSLLPKEGTQPKFTQLYFFDTQNEVRNRTRAFIDKDTAEPVDEQIVQSLIQMLDEYSSVAKAFRMAKDWYNTHNMIDFHLHLHSDRKITRQYNNPTVSEVAAIIINDFGGRLFQQYLVDAYTAVKEQRLKWTRNNQDTLHVDIYHNLCDAATRGDTSATGLGKRIVLPRTFTGSPRYMMHNYQDAMALCRAYGNPDLFITFTSNLKWPEIAEILAYFPGQKAHDRSEVRTRVFKLKLTELLDDLTKKHVFGQFKAVVYVIEFQKRGLPHAHILRWLEENSKCKMPSEIDDIISAKLSSLTDDPAGYKVVTEYMLHGPCGKYVRYAACTTDGKCSKHFPKPFLAETFLDVEGYPHYHRRDNKLSFYLPNQNAITLRDSENRAEHCLTNTCLLYYKGKVSTSQCSQIGLN
ncbi:DNA helicase PIF1, ATP-dependent [Tanacetum coccineum]|uniref:DNA helicase PIF1, ATP-dependent n=1 Tax=Tanacetum coccineum TaxID=301880 RepID=A0ABQ5HDU1_9ASTR